MKKEPKIVLGLSDKTFRFFNALRSGKTSSALVEDMINDGARVDEKNETGETALMIASYNSKPEVIKTLVAAGAEIDVKDDYGATPLLNAVISPNKNNHEVAAALIDAGARVNEISGCEGYTPLMLAIEKSNNTDTIKLLIDKGANINYENESGETPLIKAVEYDNIEAIEVLIKSGAYVNFKTKPGYTALKVASSRPKPEKIIELLVRHGARVNSGNFTPLMSAARSGFGVGAIKTLIGLGAKVNKKNSDGETSLMMASSSSDHEKVEVLIRAGANIHARNKEGLTSLMIAAHKSSDPEVIKTLVHFGAGVNEKNTNGETPLMIAAKGNRNYQIIAALIDCGADKYAAEPHGNTALMLAAKNNDNAEVINFFVETGKDDIEWRNDDGDTPLILAAGFNKSFDVCKMVEILVEAGADVNARNEKGLSPLMLLVKNSYNYDLMKLLVKAGADLHAKCKNGKTVLEYSKENEVQLMTSAVSHFFKE